MKVVLFFEVGNWEELEDRWEFKEGVGGLKSILVEEDISLAGLFDKIYGKLGLSSDMMDLVLSYSPPLNKKCSPLVLKDDEDVAALLASRSDSTCKIPLGLPSNLRKYARMRRAAKSHWMTRMVRMMDFATITSM